MAAEKEGKFQNCIFSSFFRRFHYAYNILDDRQDYVKKKKKRGATLISAYYFFAHFISRSSSKKATSFARTIREEYIDKII